MHTAIATSNPPLARPPLRDASRARAVPARFSSARVNTLHDNLSSNLPSTRRPLGLGVHQSTTVSRPLPFQEDHSTGTPPLWHGAWVGWLTCQAALLLLVESTELASDPRIALVTRTLLLTGFVVAFRKPCFETLAQRNSFTLCVVGVELGIAAFCGRMADAAGWPLWTAIGVALLLLSTSVGSLEDRSAASR